MKKKPAERYRPTASAPAGSAGRGGAMMTGGAGGAAGPGVKRGRMGVGTSGPGVARGRMGGGGKNLPKTQRRKKRKKRAS